MGRYTRKDGTVIVTEVVYDKAMNKRGISKLVHLIPPDPEFKSKAFARRLAAMLGAEFLQDVLAAQKEKAIKAPATKIEASPARKRPKSRS